MADGAPVTTPVADPHHVGAHPTERSTVPVQPGRGWTTFERTMRGAVLVLVFGVVAAALGGLAGLRTREVTAAAGRLEVQVTYAQVTRPGNSTPFEIDITSTDGAPLPAELEVRVSSAYLAMFDENGLDPEPVSSTSDGTEERWRFEVEPGSDRFHIGLDARLQPNIHSGETGTVRVGEPGSAPVEVEFRTWVLP